MIRAFRNRPGLSRPALTLALVLTLVSCARRPATLPGGSASDADQTPAAAAPFPADTRSRISFIMGPSAWTVNEEQASKLIVAPIPDNLAGGQFNLEINLSDISLGRRGTLFFVLTVGPYDPADGRFTPVYNAGTSVTLASNPHRLSRNFFLRSTITVEPSWSAVGIRMARDFSRDDYNSYPDVLSAVLYYETAVPRDL